MKKTIILTEDVYSLVKGQEITISSDTANLMVNVEKVAKFKTEGKKESKPKEKE